MNELPKFGGDRGEWVYNRIVVVKCDNSIPAELQDKKLIDKLFAERGGIVTLLIKALQRVIDNGFNSDIPRECIINNHEYAQQNSTVASFIKDCTQYRPQNETQDKVTRAYIYRMYEVYCKQHNNGYSETAQAFHKEVTQIIGEKRATQEQKKEWECAMSD